MLAFLGILSGLVFIAADLPYIRDIVRGKTQPHRTSWLIFFILNCVNVANQYASGATNSLWLVIASALLTFIIFVMSIKRGVGGLEKLDIVSLLGAVTGLLLWVVLDTPFASTVCNLSVVTIALIPTLKKAYHSPNSETHITWLIASFSGLLAALSVGAWNYQLLVLPLHDFFVQFSVYMVLVLRGRAKLRGQTTVTVFPST